MPINLGMHGRRNSFPIFVDKAITAVAQADTATSFDLPATARAGDFCFVTLTRDGGSGTSISSVSGFTTADAGPVSPWRTYMGYKFLNGSEGSSISFNHTGTGTLTTRAICTIFRGVTGVEVSSLATATNSTPNSPSFTPAAGSKKYMWISPFNCGEVGLVSTYPTSYTGITGAGPGSGVAYRALEGTTTDPGVYVCDRSVAWRAITIALWN